MPHTAVMEDEQQFLQDLEDNILGWRDSASLARFRRGCRARFGPEFAEVAPLKKPARSESDSAEENQDAA